MQKTKLGISVGLLGAAMYFVGTLSIIPAFLIAGYVLLMEDNEWLKKAAVRMAAIVISFGILSVGVGMIDNVVSVINLIVNWFGRVDIRIPLNLVSIVRYVLNLLEDFLLIIMGISALTMGTVKTGFFDKIVNKHM